MSKIKKMRLLNEMTQEQLAEKLGVSQSYLSLMERKKREITPDIDKKIIEIFGCSVKL